MVETTLFLTPEQSVLIYSFNDSYTTLPQIDFSDFDEVIFEDENNQDIGYLTQGD